MSLADDQTENPETPTDAIETAPAETSRLPGRLREGRIMAVFPADSVGSLVAALEVMVQEKVDVFSFPVSLLDKLDELAAIFGPRAVFAVHDVTADSLDRVLAGPAQLVALRRPTMGMVQRVQQAGKAALVGALTPTEVDAAASMGADAVMVVPAEVMGSSYPEQLVELVPDVTLAGRGGLGAYSARRWIEAGAAFVCLDTALVGDAATGGSLSGLRERCQTFVTAVE